MSLPPNASIAQISSVVGAFPPAFQPTGSVTKDALFTVLLKSYNAVNVSRTGYEEKYLVDYNTYNLKLNGGINYKINDNIEASLRLIGVQEQLYIPVQTGMR